MSLTATCPRCPAPAVRAGDAWACPDHGAVRPLWRPAEATYDAFVGHLELAADLPTFLPWPLGPGWTVTDFATVVDGDGAPGEAPGSRTRATMTCCSGTSELDGPVDVVVVTEEPGTGLGARCAGTGHADPGVEVRGAPPAVRVRAESQQVPLWPVSTSASTGEWDRSVMAGEAHGRWLWIVLRPASAMLLLTDDWFLRDVSALGPGLVELPFGGPPPPW